MKNVELEAFAEEVRRAAMGIVGAAGNPEKVRSLALSLCTRAANVKHGEQMAEEVQDLREDRFDLAALTVNLRAEAPERSED